MSFLERIKSIFKIKPAEKEILNVEPKLVEEPATLPKAKKVTHKKAKRPKKKK